MAASNTDDRDDDVPGDTPRELGDDDVASRWADIVATLGDMDVSRADGETGGTEKSAASSQTSRSDDEGSDEDGARGPAGGEEAGADRARGRQVGGWSDGGWAAGDWTTSGTEADGASSAAGTAAETIMPITASTGMPTTKLHAIVSSGSRDSSAGGSGGVKCESASSCASASGDSGQSRGPEGWSGRVRPGSAPAPAALLAPSASVPLVVQSPAAQPPSLQPPT